MTKRITIEIEIVPSYWAETLVIPDREVAEKVAAIMMQVLSPSERLKRVKVEEI